MVFSAPGRWEACFHSADKPLAVEEEGCGPCVQVLDSGKLLVQLIWNARDEKGVVKFVSLNKGVQTRQIRDLLRLFKIERHNLQPLRVILGIKLGQKWRLIVAVRAPASSNVHEHDLAAKTWVAVGHQFSIQIFSREGKGL